jgi:hypothetical protein
MLTTRPPKPSPKYQNINFHKRNILGCEVKELSLFICSLSHVPRPAKYFLAGEYVSGNIILLESCLQYFYKYSSGDVNCFESEGKCKLFVLQGGAAGNMRGLCEMLTSLTFSSA